MTKEERADKYAKSMCDGVDNLEDSLVYQIHYDEYIEIAAEQQKIDIGKACNVLWRYLGNKVPMHQVDIINDYTFYTKQEFIELFKQAIEE